MAGEEIFFEIPDICSEKKVTSCCKKLRKKSRRPQNPCATWHIGSMFTVTPMRRFGCANFHTLTSPSLGK